MIYKIQHSILLLDDADRPLIKFIRNRYITSVDATITVWEIIDLQIENIINQAIEDTECNT